MIQAPNQKGNRDKTETVDFTPRQRAWGKQLPGVWIAMGSAVE